MRRNCHLHWHWRRRDTISLNIFSHNFANILRKAIKELPTPRMSELFEVATAESGDAEGNPDESESEAE